nr:hypothetical protein [Tanacetum cinerariifolium]
MKVVFDRARGEEKSLAELMQDLCFSLRISLSKKRRLVAELEVLAERGDAGKPLEQIREIVMRDSVTLGDLEKLLAEVTHLFSDVHGTLEALQLSMSKCYADCFEDDLVLFDCVVNDYAACVNHVKIA